MVWCIMREGVLGRIIMLVIEVMGMVLRGMLMFGVVEKV